MDRTTPALLGQCGRRIVHGDGTESVPLAANMPDGYTWQIRLRRRGELEPRLVETRQETRKPQLLETINLHLPDGPAVRAMIVHLTFISPSTYAVTANEV